MEQAGSGAFARDAKDGRTRSAGQEAADELEIAVQALSATVEELAERLTRVSLPEGPQAIPSSIGAVGGGKAEMRGSDATEFLRATTREARRLEGRVRYLTARLDC